MKLSLGEVIIDPLPTVCSMDALVCPDGSSVGRVLPNCKFADCPTVPAHPVAGPLCFVGQKTCADGTVVGLTPGTCDFLPCPTPASAVNCASYQDYDIASGECATGLRSLFLAPGRLITGVRDGSNGVGWDFGSPLTSAIVFGGLVLYLLMRK